MDVKRILITSDDGYDSPGVRILINALKNDFELSVSGTVAQMSGVGGALSMGKAISYEEKTVDGVPVLAVYGTPCDAVEAAQAYFDHPFDLVLSGINWGPNVSAGLISSGTFSAALRAISVGLAPKGMALSWQCPEELWIKRHGLNDELDQAWHEYPGKVAGRLIRQSIREDFWGGVLLNVNFPPEPSEKVKFVSHLPDLTQCYAYPVTLDREKQQFVYTAGYSDRPSTNENYDSVALQQGWVTVSFVAETIEDVGKGSGKVGKTIELER